jgi:hypothetical protein
VQVEQLRSHGLRRQREVLGDVPPRMAAPRGGELAQVVEDTKLPVGRQAVMRLARGAASRPGEAKRKADSTADSRAREAVTSTGP